jgi:hypothetical protein
MLEYTRVKLSSLQALGPGTAESRALFVVRFPDPHKIYL